MRQSYNAWPLTCQKVLCASIPIQGRCSTKEPACFLRASVKTPRKRSNLLFPGLLSPLDDLTEQYRLSMLEAILSNLSWPLAGLVGKLVLIYIICRTLYRLYLHPLAKFPGPKLAAASRWYEAYYDIVLPGQYEFRIQRMHDEYGTWDRCARLEGI